MMMTSCPTVGICHPPDTPPPTLHDAQPPTHPFTHPQLGLDSHVMPLGYCDNEGITHAEPNHDITIEQLTHKLFASGNTGGNWTEEMDHMGLQGEYNTPTIYSSSPDQPSPAPLHPPRPSTSSYMLLRPYHKLSCT